MHKHLMRYTVSLLFSMASFVFVLGQSTEDALSNFSGLKAAGQVPAVMTGSSLEKYEEQSDREISKDEQKRLRKEKDQFYLSSTYQVDALMKSGSVIFGDDISLYLNRLKNEILDANGLSLEKNRIEVFTVKSATINAFATDQGIIFFTTGLFARLENEAQVAFILGHELSHYLEKHNIDSHVKESELKKRGRTIDSNALVSQLSKYSRDHEFSADKKGYELFSKLNYKRNESMAALNKLGYIHVSQFDDEFSTAQWEDEHYVFPDSIFDSSYNEVVPKLDNDDEESSHPKLKNRIEALEKFIEEEGSTNESNLGMSELEFKKLVEKATFETLQQNMMDFNYLRSFYDAYCLKKDYPENQFIDRVLAHSIYGLAKFKTRYEYLDEEVVEEEEEVDEESGDEEVINDQQGPETAVYKMGVGLNDDQLLALALRINLKMHEKYKNDESYYKIAEDIAVEMVRKNQDVLERFKNDEERSDSTFFLNALKSFENQEIIDALFKEAENVVKKEEKSKDDTSAYLYEESNNKGDKTRTSTLYPYIKRDLREEQIDDIIIFAPQATQLRLNYSTDLIKSENRRGEFIELIQETSIAAGVNSKVYSYHNLKGDDTEMINHMSFLGEYIAEVMEYKDIDKVPFKALDENVLNKLGSDHVMFMSMIENRKIRLSMGNFLKIFTVYGIPDVVLKGFIPQRRVSYENYVLNIKNQELEYFDRAKLFCRNNKGQLKSKYYNLFNNLKK